MSGELQQDYISGKTVYFLIRDVAGNIWDAVNTQLTAYVSANFANYPVSATEQGTSGYFTGNFPNLGAQIYNIVAKQRVGGSPAETDITIGTGTLIWDGSQPQNIASIVAAILSSDITGQAESNNPVHSLTTVILKLTSKFDAKTGQTFKTDGTTVKMTQGVQTDNTLLPIRSLGVGS